MDLRLLLFQPEMPERFIDIAVLGVVSVLYSTAVFCLKKRYVLGGMRDLW
jgi:hypothetical protein